jgi:hypothetical protein
VFICSACNAEVENPAYVWSPPWRSWRTDRGRHYPALFFNWLAPFERFCGSELARLFA